jgi:hypothetical protein
MSLAHHGPTHDPLSSMGDCKPSDDNPIRMSLVSCLASGTVAIAAR